jgi:D-arabinose 1-dehydrogenase-like Zn-dependent alcohol dehydrogenase
MNHSPPESLSKPSKFENNQGRLHAMEKGQKLVIVGMGGVGGPAAMLARKLLPGVDITVIREEDRFIVR